jgi:phosphoglycerate dehydrogenase-like enzyme
MINASLFQLMKPGSYFVNTARGGLVVESDLITALQSGPLAGAGLDVFAQEPPSADNPLLSMPNVVLSPHIGGGDTRAIEDMAMEAAQCVIDLSNGRWPAEAVVNPAVRPRWG